MPLLPTVNKAGRYYAKLSPIYFWALTVEAWLKNRSLAEEAGSLLSAKLMERTPKRDEMLNEIAARLDITKDELVAAIYAGTIASDDFSITDAADEPKD